MQAEHASGVDPARRSALRRPPSIAALYLAVVAGPPCVFYFGLASSQTLGFALVALVVLACTFKPLSPAWRKPAPKRTNFFMWTGIVLAPVLLHFAVAAATGSVDATRALASLVPLALLISAGGTLSNAFLAVTGRRLHRQMLRCYLLLCGLAVLAAAGVAVPSPEDWRRPVFPFSEPSVFALAFAPLLMYACVTSRGRQRWIFLLLGIDCTIFIQNLTLAVGFVLVAAVTLRWQYILLVATLVALGGAQLDLSYYSDRLDVSGEVQNLSNLVYVQGWQMIGEAFDRSRGLGLGFQQLGVGGTEVPAAQVLRALREGEDMNLLDGGFVFAKLASDFGVAGILLGVVFLARAFSSFRALRALAARRITFVPALVLAHCTVLSYTIELFVRGAGYFTGGSLLVVASFVLLGSRRSRSTGRRWPQASHPLPIG